MARLPNYLRSNRKQQALSQEEVAFLLGTYSGVKVCRHEQFANAPDLVVALAYQVILQKSASELFAGLYQRVQKEVAERAKILAHKVDREKSNRLNARRRQTLINIINSSSN
jgi:transcriptional regulator with XRE-family HTH domain